MVYIIPENSRIRRSNYTKYVFCIIHRFIIVKCFRGTGGGWGRVEAAAGNPRHQRNYKKGENYVNQTELCKPEMEREISGEIMEVGEA